MLGIFFLGLLQNAFDLAAVDFEFVVYGSLAVARLVPPAYRLLQRWRFCWRRYLVSGLPEAPKVLRCPGRSLGDALADSCSQVGIRQLYPGGPRRLCRSGVSSGRGEVIPRGQQ